MKPCAQQLHRLLIFVVLACNCVCRAATPIEVIDDAGATVRLDRPARRIVSLSPAATETLFSVGAGSAVVGTVAYSDQPPAARAIPRIGDAFSLNQEAVIAARPDLVVVWGSGTPAQQIAALQRLRLPVYVSEPHGFADVASTLERFGVLTGHEQNGRRAATALRAQAAALKQAYAASAPIRVFAQIGEAPLMTLNGHHWLTEALRYCGARNVFAELPTLTPLINREAVLRIDPDAIVAFGGTDSFNIWRAFATMKVVRRQAFVNADPAILRPSPAMLDATRRLCEDLDALRRAHQAD